jgi:hypothetical protein
MPFFTHHRQHSWPPFRTSTPPQTTTSTSSTPRSSSSSRLATQKHASENDMDINPFSFFISPAMSESDTDSEDDDFASAGITIEKKRSRSLSPLPLRGSGNDSEISFYDEQFQTPRPRSPKSVLNRFIEKHVHHTDNDDEDVSTTLTRSKSFSSALSSLGSGRGRAGYDLGSFSSKPAGSYQSGFERGRVTVRSHSPKPRSWREPSRELWPVMEDPEREEEWDGEGESNGMRWGEGSECLFAKSI